MTWSSACHTQILPQHQPPVGILARWPIGNIKHTSCQIKNEGSDRLVLLIRWQLSLDVQADRIGRGSMVAEDGMQPGFINRRLLRKPGGTLTTCQCLWLVANKAIMRGKLSSQAMVGVGQHAARGPEHLSPKRRCLHI